MVTDQYASEEEPVSRQTATTITARHPGGAIGHGSVVNISSIFGTSGGFGTSPAYHAAKGAVRTLTKNVALQGVSEGVRVNSIHPGFIRTPILDQAKETEILGGDDRLDPDGPARRA